MALGSHCVINARGHLWGLVGAVTLPEAHRVGGHSLVIRDHIRKYHSLSVACKDMKGLRSIMPSKQPSSLLLLLDTAAFFSGCLSKPEALLWNSFPISFLSIYIYLFVWLHCIFVAACKIQFPDQGSNLGPLHWECGVLVFATEPQGKCGFQFLDPHTQMPPKAGHPPGLV